MRSPQIRQEICLQAEGRRAPVQQGQAVRFLHPVHRLTDPQRSREEARDQRRRNPKGAQQGFEGMRGDLPSGSRTQSSLCDQLKRKFVRNARQASIRLRDCQEGQLHLS